jgi:hypothetical protein
MDSILQWLRSHRFQVHCMALGVMISTAVALYYAAKAGLSLWIWGLMGLFILGNLLELTIP